MRGSPRPFNRQPGPAIVCLSDLLLHSGMSGGRGLLIGSGDASTAVYLVRLGFEVHVMDEKTASQDLLESHGARFHNHPPCEPWLFEDGFFDFVIDEEARHAGSGRREQVFPGELRRVLKPWGYCLIGNEIRRMEKGEGQL